MRVADAALHRRQQITAKTTARRIGAFEELRLHDFRKEILRHIFRVRGVAALLAGKGVNRKPVCAAKRLECVAALGGRHCGAIDQAPLRSREAARPRGTFAIFWEGVSHAICDMRAASRVRRSA